MKSLNVPDTTVFSMVQILICLQVVAITAPSRCGANASVANETWGSEWPTATEAHSEAVFSFGTPVVGVPPRPPHAGKGRRRLPQRKHHLRDPPARIAQARTIGGVEFTATPLLVAMGNLTPEKWERRMALAESRALAAARASVM